MKSHRKKLLCISVVCHSECATEVYVCQSLVPALLGNYFGVTGDVYGKSFCGINRAVTSFDSPGVTLIFSHARNKLVLL